MYSQASHLLIGLLEHLIQLLPHSDSPLLTEKKKRKKKQGIVSQLSLHCRQQLVMVLFS